MLNDHFVEITKHRFAVLHESEIGPSMGNMLRIFDALLELLKHAAEADARLREHLNDHEAIKKGP